MSHDGEVDALATRARDGDPQAFDLLVRRLVRPALAAALEFVPTREDAEDIVQDAFARAWRDIAHYDPSQPFAPWFFTVLRNLARNAARWDRRWSMIPLTDEAVADESWDAVNVLDRKELAGRISTALDTLSPMQRACFRLTEIEGFASAAAGEMLGVSDATVRVHAHRARKALRARLAAERRKEES